MTLEATLTRRSPVADDAFELLAREVGEPGRHLFYVVGTPAMVKASVRTLVEAGVNSERIRSEDFSGYHGWLPGTDR